MNDTNKTPDAVREAVEKVRMAISAVTAEMRRFMPNACGDWADQIDALIAGLEDQQPLTTAEHAELCGYIHGKDYRDNSIEAVAYRTKRYADLKRRYDSLTALDSRAVKAFDMPEYAPDDTSHLEGLASYLDGVANEKGRAGLPSSKSLFQEVAKRLREYDVIRNRSRTGDAEEGRFSLSHDDDPAFLEAWADMEAKGFAYGNDALESVHLGWLMAKGVLSATPAPAVDAAQNKEPI